MWMVDGWWMVGSLNVPVIWAPYGANNLLVHFYFSNFWVFHSTLLCRPSGLLPCLHTSQNLTWLLIWRILFRQASCARAAAKCLLELELAQVASLALLAWFGLLLDLDCCSGRILISRLAVAWECVPRVCFLSCSSNNLILLFSTFHSNIILQTVLAGLS